MMKDIMETQQPMRTRLIKVCRVSSDGAIQPNENTARSARAQKLYIQRVRTVENEKYWSTDEVVMHEDLALLRAQRLGMSHQ